MAKRKIDFVNGEIYHVTMRGVDGRLIFMDDEDRWNAIFGAYEFNRKEQVTIREQREKRARLKELLKSARGPASGEIEAQLRDDSRTKLVDILGFVLMPNHVHFLLRQLQMDGITLFVQKFNTGQVMHFNNKYERKGTLFQGRFSATHIDGDDYLKTVFVYIHTNPLSIIEPGWKEKGVRDMKAAIEFLENYRWSSYPDYLEKKNFPSITERDLMTEIFGGAERIKEFVDAWIDYKHGIII